MVARGAWDLFHSKAALCNRGDWGQPLGGTSCQQAWQMAKLQVGDSGIHS